MILQETKREVLEARMVGSLWRARFRNWVHLPSIGGSGGILVMWDVRTIQVIDNLVGSFTVSIKIEKGEDFWWLTGVYGPASYKERKFLSEELAGLQVICGEKWVSGGDFNVIRFTHEKSPPKKNNDEHEVV